MALWYGAGMDLPSGFTLTMPGGIMRAMCDRCAGYGSAVPRDGWQTELLAWCEGHVCAASNTPDLGRIEP